MQALAYTALSSFIQHAVECCFLKHWNHISSESYCCLPCKTAKNLYLIQQTSRLNKLDLQLCYNNG